MANFVATGTGGNTSADFTLLATDTVLLNLCMADAVTEAIAQDAAASVQVKTSTGYSEVAVLNARNPVQLISGPGTYRVKTKPSTLAFGVDKT